MIVIDWDLVAIEAAHKLAAVELLYVEALHALDPDLSREWDPDRHERHSCGPECGDDAVC